jgi:hypothetical protein
MDSSKNTPGKVVEKIVGNANLPLGVVKSTR